MDSSMIEATQALEFDEYEEEGNPDDDHHTVGYLKVPCQKGFPGKSYPIIEGENLIGRGDTCTICIPLKGLSREHACIEVKGGNHFIYDKGSRNKTRRNKFFLATSVRYELKDKDELIFGDVNCTYSIGTQVADDDDTGSETGSELMFETAPPADSLTIMDTPAPSTRVRKGFADDLVLPESDSETEMDDNETAMLTTLAADTQAGNDSTEHLLGAPTQAFVGESDVTTDDDDSPRKRSLLTAATQAYEMDTASEEDSPRKRSLLTAATQAFVADSDESTPKKVAKKQIEYEQTAKYDMTVGIEPTQGYDMDEEEEESGKDQGDESEQSRLLCQPTQAFLGSEGREEEDDTDNSKLLGEPTQAFLGNKGTGDDEDTLESSEEFVLEGDTDNEEDEEEAKDMFAAPTLACDAEDPPSEEEADDGQTVKVDADENDGDQTQAVTDDATQAVDANGIKETVPVNEDPTQPVVDTDKPMGKGRDTGADADETQAVGTDDKTTDKAANQEDIQTQVFDNDKTQAVNENDDTGLATQVITDDADPTVKVTEDEIATQVVEEDASVAILDIGDQGKGSVKATEECEITDNLIKQESDVFDINAVATLAPSNSVEFEDGSDSKPPDDSKQEKSIEELETQVLPYDATAEIVMDETVAVAPADTVAVSETVAVEETVPVSTDEQDLPADTVAISETVPVSTDEPDLPADTVAISETVPVSADESGLPEQTVPVINDGETMQISETVPVDQTAALSDSDDDPTQEPDRKGTNDQNAETLQVQDHDTDNSHKITTDQKNDTEVTSLDDSDNVKGKRGRPNKNHVSKGNEQRSSRSENAESAEVPSGGRRGKRGKASLDYAALNKGKRKSVKVEPDKSDIQESNSRDTSSEDKNTSKASETVTDSPADSHTSGRGSRGRNKKQTAASVKSTRNKRGQTDVRDAGSVNEAGDQPRVGRGRKVREREPDNIAGEPETQAYMEKSPQKGRHSGEATQIYQDEDATPSLTEICTPEEEDTDPRIIPEPELVPIPSKSPLKSAIASPEKKKSPSPKRVQFTSQNSETGSESSQAGGRSRRSRKSLPIEPENDSKGVKGKSKAKKKVEVVNTTAKEEVGTEDAVDKVESVAEDVSKKASGRPKRGANVDTEEDKPTSATDQGPGVRKRAAREKQITLEKIDTAKSEGTKETNVSSDTVGGRRTRGKKSDINVEVESDDSGTSAGKGRSAIKGIVKTNKDTEEAVPDNAVRKTTRGKKSDNVQVESEDLGTSTGKDEGTSAGKSKSAGKGKDIVKTNKDSEEAVPDNAVRKTTRGKVKQAQDSDKIESKRKSKVLIKPGDNEDSEQNSQSSENTSNTRRKTRGNLAEVIESNKTSQSLQGKKSLQGEECGSKVDTQNSKSTGNRNTKVKQDENADKVDEKEEVTERSSRTRGNKVGQESQTDSQTSKSGNTKNAITKGLKKKHNEKSAEISISKQDGSDDSGTKLESERTRRARSKQQQQQQPAKDEVGDKKPADEEQIKVEEIQARPNRRAGKRKESDDSSERECQAPAQKQKVKAASSASQTKSVMSTPKSNVKKEAGCETPKGKQLDTSAASSPTLRKTTTNGMKPKVMFTGVTDEQGEKIVKDLGGEMVTSVTECTHLVTDQIRRTVKFLCCLARGIPIVTPQWLTSSKKCGFFADTSAHLIRDEVSERKFKCNIRRSINKASEMLLFTGYKIHVTKSVKPGPDQMKDILQCAGAQYVPSLPKNGSPTTVVVSCEEDRAQCELAIKNGISVANPEFILTGILRQEVDLNSYLISSESSDRKSLSQEPPHKRRKR